ncbi:hypothetical protein HPC62_07600 [Thermoleptolyngbya sichuanensis A183]|uniref:Uncharacterized protein n=1 Tax=Thermoleptolyngbya sichuanensis A183 TaxID=2737172 RepID=A0A6M8BG08_9CYAN|nr:MULTISPECIES: hypothetical protein [Thermoleptolyngbya]QKD82083.1 hypothetical protein HPC62_07600 [Thermoleptolyngbya sichuanensis A183]
MALQFNQIDRIKDFDEAIAVLESDYVPALVKAFANSPEGQAYLKAQPHEQPAQLWHCQVVFHVRAG